MFTLIAARHRCRVRLQRRRDAGPVDRPDRGSGTASPLYFEAAAVITALVLLGQVLELRARSSDRQRDARAPRARAEDGATAGRRRQRERRAARATSRSAIGCACDPARRCPSTASCSRARSARRRVDGHRRADPGGEGGRRARHGRHGERARAGFVMRAERVGRDTLLAQIVRMVSEAQRSRAPDPAPGRRRRRVVRARGDRRRRADLRRVDARRSRAAAGLRARRRRSRC